MDQRSRKTIERMELGQLGPDDTFRFHCTMCGKCCIDREDILLNPYDIYRMAKQLSMEPAEVLNTYCEWYVGSTSHMVIIRLLPQGPQKRCPLLQGKRCSVHAAKPTVCALFPLGRSMRMPTDGTRDFNKAELVYFMQDIRCGDKSEKHTVREWLQEFDLPIEADFFRIWTQTVMDCGSILKQLQGKVSSETIGVVCAAILGGLYLNYDTAAPFTSQFEANRGAFFKTLAEIGITPESPADPSLKGGASV